MPYVVLGRDKKGRDFIAGVFADRQYGEAYMISNGLENSWTMGDWEFPFWVSESNGVLLPWRGEVEARQFVGRGPGTIYCIGAPWAPLVAGADEMVSLSHARVGDEDGQA